MIWIIEVTFYGLTAHRTFYLLEVVIVDLQITYTALFFQFFLKNLHIILIETISKFVVKLAFAQVEFKIWNLFRILSDAGNTLGYAFAQQALVDTLVDTLIGYVKHIWNSEVLTHRPLHHLSLTCSLLLTHLQLFQLKSIVSHRIPDSSSLILWKGLLSSSLNDLLVHHQWFHFMKIVRILLYILQRKWLIQLLLLISVVVILIFIRVNYCSDPMGIVAILSFEQVLLTFAILAIFIAILSCFDLFLMNHPVHSFNWFSLIRVLLFLFRLLLLLVVNVYLQLWLDELLVFILL